jgi:catalase (peroxidase I)
MGFEKFGFAGGRADAWEPEELSGVPRGRGSATNIIAVNASLPNPLAPCRWA